MFVEDPFGDPLVTPLDKEEVFPFEEELEDELPLTSW